VANKQLPDGLYIRNGKIWIDCATPQGRVRRSLKLDDTKEGRKAALAILNDVRIQASAGTFMRKDAPRFGEYVLTWIDAQGHLAKSTWESYRKILNRYWLPQLGDRRINEVTGTEIGTLLAGSGVAAKTRNNILSPLKRVFDSAMMDGLIEKDPTTRVRFTKAQKPVPEPMTAEEVNRVLEWMEREPLYRNYFEFAFFSGLRTSELIALRWTDIDFSRRTALVRSAKVRRETKGTKTGTTRTVELTGRAISALQRQPRDYPHIFFHPRTRSQFNDDKAPRLFWTEALKELGLRHRAAYQTRHTYATMALMAGANPMWVARQLGHANMGMLLTRYSRWIEHSDHRSEVNKLEAK
jgi:integrase